MWPHSSIFPANSSTCVSVLFLELMFYGIYCHLSCQQVVFEDVNSLHFSNFLERVFQSNSFPITVLFHMLVNRNFEMFMKILPFALLEKRAYLLFHCELIENFSFPIALLYQLIILGSQSPHFFRGKIKEKKCGR